MSKTRTKFTFVGRTLCCAIVAIAANAHAALPPTHPGALDPGFSGGAVLFHPISSRTDFAMAVTTQADGKVLFAGYGQDEVVQQADVGYITRHNADGSLDSSFATAGVRKFGDAANGRLVIDMLAAADGK